MQKEVAKEKHQGLTNRLYAVSTYVQGSAPFLVPGP